jgi:3-oxoacyl-[acyl-carrier-protein] synthase III
MKPISLVAVASQLPETIVGNDFFPPVTKPGLMFVPPTTRRHMQRDETAADMLARAAGKLVERLNLTPARDIDLLFTNVSVPDMPFTGCGGEVARLLGARPQWVLDLHNTGCVAFVYMLELARHLMQTAGAKTALLCTGQTAAGRIFTAPDVRIKPQAAVPGDGFGVGYVVASDESPILSVVHRAYGEHAGDMRIICDDDRRWWETGEPPFYVDFNEAKMAAVIRRGNRIVPELIFAACRDAGVTAREIDLLVTNQPNPYFLRNWREAIELPKEAYADTFDTYGNMFGAAIPITLDQAIAGGQLKPGGLLALAGFAHASDYAAATLIRWHQNESPVT